MTLALLSLAPQRTRLHKFLLLQEDKATLWSFICLSTKDCLVSFPISHFRLYHSPHNTVLVLTGFLFFSVSRRNLAFMLRALPQEDLLICSRNSEATISRIFPLQ